MKLETKRLTILPLTPAQLALWTDRIPQLEKELDCSYQAEPMEGIFKEIVCGTPSGFRSENLTGLL